MYPIFAMWIRSHKDLPLRIYETVSSFRYETKHTRPLIRDREISFWYEIHTAHTTKEESEEELKEHMRINDLIWDALAIPNLKVDKPQWEVFPGAVGAIEYYAYCKNLEDLRDAIYSNEKSFIDGYTVRAQNCMMNRYLYDNRRVLSAFILSAV